MDDSLPAMTDARARHIPPGNSPWPALWRSQDVAIVLLTLGAMVLIQLLLLSTARAPSRYQGLNGLAFAIFPTFITAVGLVVRARVRGVTAQQIGLVRPRTWRPVLIAWLVAIAAGPVTIYSRSLLAVAGGPDVEIGPASATLATSGLGRAAAFALVIALLVPIVEELIFRGLVHRTVRTRWPLIPSAVLSG